MKYGQRQIDFFRNRSYLKKEETLEDRINDIVNVVKHYEKDYSEGLADRIKYYIDEQILSLSTPQWANLGREKEGGSKTQPLNCSCNIITYPNSIAGIYYAHGETAMLSKLGAGVGTSWLKVAQKATLLEEGFHTNPKLDWIEDSIRSSQKVSQQSVRRGYSVPFMSIDDKEFYEFLQRADKKNPNKNDPIVKNNVGVILPKNFWNRLKEEKELQKRLLSVIQKRKSKGKIYMLDVDNCNKNQSPVYEKLGHFVDSTNICCVTGDQMVATKKGFKTVKELSDLNIELELFDNEEVHNSTAMLYRGNADVHKITLNNGMEHTITSNHELIVRARDRKVYQKSIDTGLSVGDKVLVQTNKGLFGKRHEPGLAFLLGLFLGDGTEQGNGLRLSIWENDFDLITEVENICDKFCNKENIKFHPNSNHKIRFVDSYTGDSDVKRKNLHTNIFNTNGFPFKKGEIPHWIWDADEDTHWQLLRGLLYADGTVGDYNTGKSFGKPINLSLASIDIDLLKKIQIISSNLGMKMKIYSLREGDKQLLPKNDGSNKSEEYNTKHCYRLVLSNKNDLLKLEKNTNFLYRKNINFENKIYRDNSQKSSKIISIEHQGKKDVYCPTVDSNKHLWVCNGIITSNTEALTPSYSDKTFACILSSLNLKYWDTIKNNPQIIKDVFMFLDINVEEYIRLTKGVPFLDKAHKSAIEKRDIGLGTLGFHEHLQSQGCAFGDLKSRSINKEIYSTIRKYGEETTKEMAENLGSPKLCKDADLTRRNVSLMMIAPNKSTSYLCGETSLGIEPFISNYFAQDLAGKHSIFKNPYLKDLLEKKGKDTVETWNSVSKNNGSVQHLDFLSDEEKLVFRTATEISPKDMIDLAADRQEYIDMSQSLNLFNRPDYTTQDVYDIHKYAFSKGIKTLYYFYPSGHASIETSIGENWDACSACAD